MTDESSIADRSTDEFRKAILRQLDYFRDEFNLTYAAAIGVLTIITVALATEVTDEESDE